MLLPTHDSRLSFRAGLGSPVIRLADWAGRAKGGLMTESCHLPAIRRAYFQSRDVILGT